MKHEPAVIIGLIAGAVLAGYAFFEARNAVTLEGFITALVPLLAAVATRYFVKAVPPQDRGL